MCALLHNASCLPLFRRLLSEHQTNPRRTHQVCVWIDSTTATAAGAERRTRSGPFCFDGPQNDLPIQGLELGSHRWGFLDHGVHVCLTMDVLFGVVYTSQRSILALTVV